MPSVTVHKEEIVSPALYESVEVGTLTADDGTPFSIRAGLTKDLVAKLIERSQDLTDTVLQESTSDRERFTDEASYESWYQKDRYPYVLVSQNGELAALVWFGPGVPPEEVPLVHEFTDTIAFRAYAPYRGMRLMTPFGRLVIERYEAQFPGRKLWLETNAGNEAGIGLFSKLGFSKVADSKGGKRIVMTRS